MGRLSIWKTEPAQRRFQVLLLVDDLDLLVHCTDLCGSYHCSAFHLTPRPDGLLRNLPVLDFDIAILSLRDSHELAWALSILEKEAPQCITITCQSARRAKESFLQPDENQARILPFPTAAVKLEDAFVAALVELERRALNPPLRQFFAAAGASK